VPGGAARSLAEMSPAPAVDAQKPSGSGAASASPRDPAPPRAFGSGEPQDRETLRAAPLRSRPRPSRLERSLQTLKGAGPKLAALAREIGIETVGDLLWHLPHGYRDLTERGEVAGLKIGEEATLEVEVRAAKLRRTRRRGLTILEVTVADESGPAKAVWFNQPWLADKLTPGTRLLIHG